jgi:hypothetical protein
MAFASPFEPLTKNIDLQIVAVSLCRDSRYHLKDKRTRPIGPVRAVLITPYLKVHAVRMFFSWLVRLSVSI